MAWIPGSYAKLLGAAEHQVKRNVVYSGFGISVNTVWIHFCTLVMEMKKGTSVVYDPLWVCDMSACPGTMRWGCSSAWWSVRTLWRAALCRYAAGTPPSRRPCTSRRSRTLCLDTYLQRITSEEDPKLEVQEKWAQWKRLSVLCRHTSNYFVHFNKLEVVSNFSPSICGYYQTKIIYVMIFNQTKVSTLQLKTHHRTHHIAGINSSLGFSKYFRSTQSSSVPLAGKCHQTSITNLKYQPWKTIKKIHRTDLDWKVSFHKKYVYVVKKYIFERKLDSWQRDLLS